MSPSPTEEPLDAAWQAGDFPRVLAVARAALALAPGDARATGWLGLAHWALGELEPARAALERAAAALQGPEAPALRALADRLVLHPAHGGPAAAHLVVESLGLEHPASLRALASEAAQAGEVQAGVALLRRGLAQDDADGQAHYLLARLLARLGKRPNALRHLRAALAEPEGHLAVRRQARHEPDFDAMRDDPDFQELLGTLPMEEVLRPLYAALDRADLDRVAGLAPGLLGIARNPLDVLLPWQEALERLAASPGGEAHAAALAEVARRLAPYQARGEVSVVYLAFNGRR